MVVVTPLVVALSLAQVPGPAAPAAPAVSVSSGSAATARISGRVTLEVATTPIAGARVMLAPAFSVSGLVVDENGAPVGGAFVTIMHDPRTGGFLGPVGSARTREDGQFTMASVPSGTYRVSATVPTTMSSAAATSGGVVGGVVTGVPGGSPVPPNRFQPTDVAVEGANVAGVRVVAIRPVPR